jgi:hypothetical protein
MIFSIVLDSGLSEAYNLSMNINLIVPLWERISATTAEALRMTDGEASSFKANRVAKLIGLLPFIAGCEDAHRTSLAHLATFVLANRGQARGVFDHGPADDVDVLTRLRTISDFKGGDKALIDRGMALLGLDMVAGYRRDVAKDALTGEYNPAASGAWPGAAQEKTLKDALAAKPSVEMDAIIKESELSVLFWEQ